MFCSALTCPADKRQTVRRAGKVCEGISWPGHDDMMIMHPGSFLLITVVS